MDFNASGYTPRFLMRAVGCALLACLCACAKGRPVTEEDFERSMPVWVQQRTHLGATDRPFLWMISTQPPSFLYGTIHVPDDRVLALPGVVERAFRSSDVVCTEIHLDQESEERTRAAYLLPEGQSLQDLLPPDLYGRTEAIFKERGYSFGELKKCKVWAVMIHVQLIEYLAKMQAKEYLDQMLYNRALREGKEADALETFEDHFRPFDLLSPGDQVGLLREALDVFDRAEHIGSSPTDPLVNAYLSGDGPSVMRASNELMDPGSATNRELIRTLVGDRNRAMLANILERLRQDPDKIHFFAVGTMHYLGPGSIIEGLRSSGYDVERMQAGDVQRLEQILGAAVPGDQ